MQARKLTTTEIRTAKLLAEGQGRKAIARIEQISLGSVNSRVDSILFKTGSYKAIEAIHKIAKRGLICVCLLILTANTDTEGQRRYRRGALRGVRVEVQV